MLFDVLACIAAIGLIGSCLSILRIPIPKRQPLKNPRLAGFGV
jgi:hypothetical protein